MFYLPDIAPRPARRRGCFRGSTMETSIKPETSITKAHRSGTAAVGVVRVGSTTDMPNGIGGISFPGGVQIARNGTINIDDQECPCIQIYKGRTNVGRFRYRGSGTGVIRARQKTAFSGQPITKTARSTEFHIRPGLDRQIVPGFQRADRRGRHPRDNP